MKEDKNKTTSGPNPETSGEVSPTRRQFGRGVGGAVTGIILASGWKTPLVDSVMLPAHAQTSPASDEMLPTVTTDSADGGFVLDFSAQGTVVDDGSAPVTERGFVLSNSPNPTIADTVVMDGSGGPGTFSVTNASTGGLSGAVFVRAYAINSVGVAYGGEIEIDVDVCLARGTLVALADGSSRAIENIGYDDELLVWNFDLGCFDKAKPLYIKTPGLARRYNLLEFNDGATLKTIVQHRIFNKQAGRFTYPMTDETPVGTVTFNRWGKEVILVNKKVVTEPVEYYNVITHFHMNLFGNGILTSIGYNNLYPIREMKFVKDNRRSIALAEYQGIDDKFYSGLRLAEQVDIPIEKTIAYVQRRETISKPRCEPRFPMFRSMAGAGESSRSALR